MANIKTDGLDSLVQELENININVDAAIGEALFKGAGIVADAIRQEVKNIPKDAKLTPMERAGLLAGIGIAKVDNRDGFRNVRIGFAGYNEQVTDSYPKGTANALIARSVAGGNYFRSAYNFIAKATKKSKDNALNEMRIVFDKKINSIK